VVSATHRDLESMIERDELRRDLYARLAGYELSLPPLCERSVDLGHLVGRLLAEVGAPRASFTADAALAMASYSWPLNVRELKAALVQAVALAAGDPLGLEHLPRTLREPAAQWAGERAVPRPAGREARAPGVETPRDAKTRAQLVELLTAHAGNVAAVARAMGKHRRQIHRWMDQFELAPNDFRT
jgi:DNA-binding NtrC family response regulator